MTFDARQRIQNAIISLNRLRARQQGGVPDSGEARKEAVTRAREAVARSVDERLRRQSEVRQGISEVTKSGT